MQRAKRSNGDSRDAVRKWRRHQRLQRAQQRIIQKMKKS